MSAPSMFYRTAPLANGRIMIDMTADARGAADGMKVDIAGNLYVTGAGGHGLSLRREST